MAVTTPRETWTDPRIDDLSKKVDEGYAGLDKKMDAGFEHVDKRFDKVDTRFEQVDAKMQAGFDRLDKKFDWPIRILLGAAVAAILPHVFS